MYEFLLFQIQAHFCTITLLLATCRFSWFSELNWMKKKKRYTQIIINKYRTKCTANAIACSLVCGSHNGKESVCVCVMCIITIVLNNNLVDISECAGVVCFFLYIEYNTRSVHSYSVSVILITSLHTFTRERICFLLLSFRLCLHSTLNGVKD